MKTYKIILDNNELCNQYIEGLMMGIAIMVARDSKETWGWGFSFDKRTTWIIGKATEEQINEIMETYKGLYIDDLIRKVEEVEM